MTAKAPASSLLQKSKILLVDDHAVVRFGIGQLINKQPDLMVCGEAETAGKALDLIGATTPDLVIVDITLKESSGLELIKNVKIHHPKTPVLVVSMHDESIHGEMAMRAGALGYIMKEEAMEKVLVAIRRVLVGEIYVSDALATKLVQQNVQASKAHQVSPIERLSDRELEVLRLIGQWKGTRQIAGELHLSIKTIEYYREQIKKKLNLKDASELVKFAIYWVQQDTST
jgi:DNA-binding NarL/FixJ family response regulator